MCEQYGIALKRDSYFRKQLDRIGQLYFGFPAPQRNGSDGGGLFGGLMNTIFSSMTADDEIDDSGEEQFETAPDTLPNYTPTNASHEADVD